VQQFCKLKVGGSIPSPGTIFKGHKMTEGTPRWAAQIIYRRNKDTLEQRNVLLEELKHLHNIVERGPHWDTIEQITIKRFNLGHIGLTLEEAEKM